MSEKQTPSQWLDEQLERRHISQNELARLMGDSHGGNLTRFRNGDAGPKVALGLARQLRVSPLEVLAVAGYIDEMPEKVDREADELSLIFYRLADADRHAIMAFARHLAN
jgi:hypothetical protein